MVQAVQEAYTGLSLHNLDTLRRIYSDDVCFEDPVHAIQGIEALVDYFQRQFANVEDCHFKFHRSIASGEGIFFSWTMFLKHRRVRPGQVIRVEGASYLRVRNDRVFYHRDYFDLGAMVYENLPLLGRIIQLIRNRMSR